MAVATTTTDTKPSTLPTWYNWASTSALVSASTPSTLVTTKQSNYPPLLDLVFVGYRLLPADTPIAHRWQATQIILILDVQPEEHNPRGIRLTLLI